MNLGAIESIIGLGAGSCKEDIGKGLRTGFDPNAQPYNVTQVLTFHLKSLLQCRNPFARYFKCSKVSEVLDEQFHR